MSTSSPLRTALLSTLLTLGSAASFTAEAGDWTHKAGISGFIFGMEGTTGINGRTGEVDSSMSDIVDHLQDALTGLVMGSNGEWGYWASYEYLELGANDSKVFFPEISSIKIRGEVSIETKIVDAGLSYNVPGVEWLELLGGIRYIDMNQSLAVQVSRAPDPVKRKLSDSQSWANGIVGARATVPITDALFGTLRVDVGAGDSDVTWQAIALLNYQLTNRWTTSLGYRFLKDDYEDDGYVFDMEMSGVEFAVTYSF